MGKSTINSHFPLLSVLVDMFDCPWHTLLGHPLVRIVHFGFCFIVGVDVLGSEE
jgi:hypothetical protein